MYVVKTNRKTGDSVILDSRSSPPNTVAKFMITEKEAREELYLRNDYLKSGLDLLLLYLDQYRYDF
jgi:hypothetical protein